MECNRDEALRAKEIAERKFLAKDIKGAKKFAIKAQKIYPELEGISQMLMTLEIYISAEDNKRHGESNWYGILGVTPLADDETIRKQYRKLALVLHPDKNRSIGAEGAFQLVSQAWSLLSDKSKRTAFDQRQRNQTNKEVPSQNGPNPARKKERRTFWTVCHRCKMQYEYLRMYLNHNLLCPNCHEAYFAVEIEPPSTKISKASSSSHASKNSGVQWVPFSESTSSRSAAQAKNMVQQAYEKVKRERQKAQAAARKEEKKKKRPMPSDFLGNLDFAKRKKGVEMKMVNCESQTLKRGVFRECSRKHDGLCRDDIKCLLMEKAREEINKRVNDARETVKENGTENAKEDSRLLVSKPNFESQMSVYVPDPDFHDFDRDRMGKSFSENQVWAVYDDRDGMPRHYTVIRDVISVNPFKVKMSRLSSVHVNWFSSGFSKTCGEFRIGGVETCDSIERFSHNVRFTKLGSKTIRIFPKKGDVWALYRNWAPDWNELTEDEVINKFDMVEVFEDYDEELGVVVVPLVKVAGFKAVFHQNLDPREIRRIPKEEMCRFSHQVPCRVLTGQEGSKSVKGCRELDPAAVPLQFLEVMSNVDEIEFIMESDEEEEEEEEEIEFVKAVDCYGNNIAVAEVEGISGGGG
ncbi:Dnaj homolog subfamily b member 14 [Phtheirospermum japonicum]|uniref:Dnaj homolog subfamily b member 14 n=1 Tax=Phtheirospermum japonicum TaxID=374723 RepID=A0A830CZB4_9LAMI|nr:Dnaj homolog subfamily b member 14 [Phtheirospermum japonicum]